MDAKHASMRQLLRFLSGRLINKFDEDPNIDYHIRATQLAEEMEVPRWKTIYHPKTVQGNDVVEVVFDHKGEYIAYTYRNKDGEVRLHGGPEEGYLIRLKKPDRPWKLNEIVMGIQVIAKNGTVRGTVNAIDYQRGMVMIGSTWVTPMQLHQLWNLYPAGLCGVEE